MHQIQTDAAQPPQQHIQRFAERVDTIAKTLSVHAADLAVLADRLLGTHPKSVPQIKEKAASVGDIDALADALDRVDAQIGMIYDAKVRLVDL